MVFFLIWAVRSLGNKTENGQKEKQGKKKNSLVLPLLILKDYKCLSKHSAKHFAQFSSFCSDMTLHEPVPAVFSVSPGSALRPRTPRTPVLSLPHSLLWPPPLLFLSLSLSSRLSLSCPIPISPRGEMSSCLYFFDADEITLHRRRHCSEVFFWLDEGVVM